MANFPTHVTVGTVVSGALATVTVATGMVAPQNVVAVTLAGVLGSVLPDIDLDDSRASRILFSGLAVFLSFAVLFSLGRQYSVAEMLVLWLGTFLLVRYGAKEAFARFSHHRGVWHSLLALVLCAFVTAWAYYNLLGRNESVAWLAAAFMGAGYLTHLVLDELYAVDVTDTRVKASFGTALKVLDHRRLGRSAAMAVVTGLVFLATPPSKGFVEIVVSRSLWADLNQRLLPRDRWFQSLARLQGPPAAPSEAPSGAPSGADVRPVSPIATGSLPPPPQPAPGAAGDH